MAKKTGQILKSDEIKLEGRFHLNPADARNNSQGQKVSALPSPHVRILENTPEYAVIGVTCSCGREISVRCDYADARARE
ncbi:MAG: hypothetical protein JW715_11980 [Sedimentisphaerales bacterium]|nr:hypothetical protein [Sedimentisphaerales bacterium]